MNNQNTPILFPYEPNELLEKIRQLLRAELQNIKHKTEEPVVYSVPGLIQKPLYKANEVCTMLRISRQTLYAWEKEGILKPYKIKSRVYFLWNDIEKILTPDLNK